MQEAFPFDLKLNPRTLENDSFSCWRDVEAKTALNRGFRLYMFICVIVRVAKSGAQVVPIFNALEIDKIRVLVRACT